MNLREQLDVDFKSSLKEKNELVLSVVRGIKAAILNAEIAKDGKGSYTDEQIIDIIKKEAKKRHDSITAYEGGGRQDLADKEKQELEILKKYLPQMMSEDEVTNLIKSVISDLKASSPADFGKVMKETVLRAKGRADGKLVSEIVKKILA